MSLPYSSFDYAENCRQLAQATRVNALLCIRLAQRQVAEALFRIAAPDRIIRLARADIVETLLARAVLTITQDPSYDSLRRDNAREDFVEIHLRMALAGWLTQHCESPAETQALTRCQALLHTSALRG